MASVDPLQAMEVARAAVDAAAEIQLRLFRTSFAVDTKPDRSPVTVADTESEAAIFAIIREAFPGHALLGEETGKHGDSEWCWVVDPLDGTRGFTRGGTYWGPIVGLARGDEPIAGAFALPAAGVTYWGAPGHGAWRHRRSAEGDDVEPMKVSRVATLADATLSLGELRALVENAGLAAIAKEAASTRCWGDVGGAAMLIDGKAEAWIESGVKPWDLCGIAPVVLGAGGRFTDFSGKVTFSSGHALATNGLLHDTLLARLARATP